jgi:hypothetical protein
MTPQVFRRKSLDMDDHEPSVETHFLDTNGAALSGPPLSEYSGSGSERFLESSSVVSPMLVGLLVSAEMFCSPDLSYR